MERITLDETGTSGDKQGQKTTRFQSTIQFPYADLESGIDLVRVIHEKCGGVSCSPDQLAAAMGQTPTSGNFRLKLSTARIFGLAATSTGRIEITDLGFEIVDPSREKAARARAFLEVELFRRVYEDFEQKQLPPRPAAFELMLERFGVSKKQKSNARRALDRSATQAGFYQHGMDRLVMPNISTRNVPTDRMPSAQRSEQIIETVAHSGGGDGGNSGMHPFIRGLLGALPEPETLWTIEGRAKWLQAAANIFDLMYKGDGQISVTVTNSAHPEQEPQSGSD